MNTALTALKSSLPAQGWTQDPDIIAPHLSEWRDRFHGHTPLMLLPRSPQEVAAAVKICAQHNIKIVPQGGNTGLVGGQTPMGEVLLSTRNMSAIRQRNSVNNSMIVEAGATLQSIHDAAEAIDRKFPLFLASQGSCTIGGNLSTNAGGNHVLKYGTAKDLVYGVEAVLANGDIYNGLTDLRKDNTGYDLSRLFLGAEGTLGIITAASLKLFPKAGHIQRVMVGLETPAKAMALLGHCRADGALSMFEVIPNIGLKAVIQNFSNQSNPFTEAYPWYAVMDWETKNKNEGLALAESLLANALKQDIILNAVIAQNETQANEILALRENLSAAQKFLGGSIKCDITVPLQNIPDFLTRTDRALEALIPGCRPVSFGHFGDGNIHYNISQPIGVDTEKFLSRWDEAAQAVFDIVGELGGSISAEHGIGVIKKGELAARADPVKLALLKTVKTALDPLNIMNPRVLINSTSPA